MLLYTVASDEAVSASGIYIRLHYFIIALEHISMALPLSRAAFLLAHNAARNFFFCLDSTIILKFTAPHLL